MIIAKFGGTSVSTKNSIQTILAIAKKQLHKQPIFVVSAVSTVTDALLCATASERRKQHQILSHIRMLHRDVVCHLFPLKQQKTCMIYIDECLSEIEKKLQKKNIRPSDCDDIASYGEHLSSFIITQALQQVGVSAQQVIGSQCIVTNNNFQSAEFLPYLTKQKTKSVLLPLVKKGIIPVVTGFIGATKTGATTTLGRGGSDYTASIIGYSVSAEEIQIWTDVDGVFTADPRVIKTAKRLDAISYKEASELATFGAKVLHPRTIRPAIFAGIPVRVLNTFQPDGIGTLITKEYQFTGAKAIASKKKVPLINIYSTEMLLSKGFLKKIFEVFAKQNISVNLVSVSEVSVSITLDNEDNIASALKELALFTTISKIESNGMVSLIGENIVSTPHLMKQIFSLFDKEDIPVRMISYGATNINISFIMPSNKIDRAVAVLHKNVVIKKGRKNIL